MNNSTTRRNGFSDFAAGVGFMAVMGLLARSCDGPTITYEALKFINERPEIVSQENFTDAMGVDFCRYHLANGEAVLLRKGLNGNLEPISPEVEFNTEETVVLKRGDCDNTNIVENENHHIQDIVNEDDTTNIFIR